MIKTRRKSKGFSLIELLVSISITCILMVLAVPSYSSWLARIKVKSTAESINLGIIQARAEAIRRNSLVRFVLNGDTSWQIIDGETNKIINQKTDKESSDHTAIAITGAMLTYNGFGLLSANEDGSNSITQVDVTSSLHPTLPALRVVVGSGGSSIICDTGSSVVDSVCRSQ